MNPDIIDIIIPTYHPGHYLLDCLKSINSQTLNHNRYQITIILNGEKEPYYSLIKKWLTEIRCVSEVVYTNQRGVSNARNIGLQKTIGQYIFFLDDDDIISPNCLEKLYDKRSTDGLVICNCLDFINNIGYNHNSFLTNAYNLIIDNSKIRYCHRSILSTCWGKLIPRALIGSRRFNNNIFIGEDCCFMISILPNIKYLRKAESECILYIRNRVGSTIRRPHSFKALSYNKYYQLKEYLKYFSKFIFHNQLIYLNRIVSVVVKWK